VSSIDELRDAVVRAAIEADRSDSPAIHADLSDAVAALLAEQRQQQAVLWVERTWMDVRVGDIIRPPGQSAHEATVIACGPVNHWHAAPNASQYRPNESPAEWSSIRVVLNRARADGTQEPFEPQYGMKPDAAVEIQVTRQELAAIEACGGWANRIGVLDS
jgi:hypothetical protein